MFGRIASIALLCLLSAPVAAEPALPKSFKSKLIPVPGDAQIFVQYGGSGPAVLLIHGYTDTGDMWGPLAAELAKTHSVIVPDLRGLGRSSRAAAGYEKKTQAADMRAVLLALGYDRADVVSHDIGGMVGYAYAARYRESVDRFVIMDVPLPGIGPWEEIVRTPQLWHFNVHGPDAEHLVQGHERFYLDRIWNDFAGNPAKLDEETRAHYAAQYAAPGAMRAGFAQFTAFSKDAEDNKLSQKEKLTIPVLAIGGEKSSGASMAAIMREVATDVRQVVVPGAGHWLMEESTAATVAMISDFLGEKERSSGDKRVALAELRPSEGTGPGTGSSGVSGIQTVVLKGNPDGAGLYTILLKVPAHTRIAAHEHPDDRIATVVSGTWNFGYGEHFDSKSLKALPPGSFYTEPARRAHFAETGDEPVMVQITGVGPSGTVYIDAASDPRHAAR